MSKIRGRSLFLFLSATLISCADRPAMQTPKVEHPARLEHPAEQIVLDAVNSGVVPGAVLLIARNGALESLRAFGYANKYGFDGARLNDPVEMTTATVFDVASLTKVFATTFALMMLVDRGEVDLDVPVYKYLPEFRGASKDSITVRHLLSHTAGLSPWKPTYFHAESADSSFEYIRSLPLDYAVGKERHYSDLGFMVLGYLIKRVSGKPVDQFVETELYRPLGLTQTEFRPEGAENVRFAATSQGNPFERQMVEDPNFGYKINEDPDGFAAWRQYTLVGEVNDGNSYYAHGGVAGHAGLFSTAVDLNRLLSLLMKNGKQDGVQFISASVIREFLTADTTGNGLGWAMSESVLPVDNMPSGAFGHTGFTGTFAYADPGRDLAIILLTNRQNGGTNILGNYPSLSALRRAVTQAATKDNYDSIPRIEN